VLLLLLLLLLGTIAIGIRIAAADPFCPLTTAEDLYFDLLPV
jgi:hypothetical protein